MDIYQIAKKYLSDGIATIPVIYRDKKPAIRWKEYQSRLPTEQELMTWFLVPRNIAVITGWRGLTVLDFDDHKSFRRWQLWATKRNPKTDTFCNPMAAFVAVRGYRVATSRGHHVYVRLTKATRTRPLLNADGKRTGVDIKSLGGYVIAPPSIHPSGKQYTSVNHLIPKVDALSDILPADLLTLPVNTEYQREGIRVPRPKPDLLCSDPWEAAERVGTFSDDLVAAIRERFKVESFFRETWSTGNGWLLARCPLHNDNDPSMWIDTVRGVCGCFVGCTVKPLDCINLFAVLSDLSNEEAILSMARLL